MALVLQQNELANRIERVREGVALVLQQNELANRIEGV